MFARFTQAIVCPPAGNFADGLTTVDAGAPDIDLALAQHAAYCDALSRHGCALIPLPADIRYPDSTFVEDTALILPGVAALITRPGASSRTEETAAIREALSPYFSQLSAIAAPGTLDAGDVCEAEHHVFIGLSHRTNHDGARQLSEWLFAHDTRAVTVDIRTTPGILHLKSGVTALGDGRLLCIAALAQHPAFVDYEILVVPDGEEYAANVVRVNDVVFVADGFPGTQSLLQQYGYRLEPLPMSEFAKMDGGLSCLSLRF
jgi:dimethylargininase